MHEATRKLLGVLLREMDGFDAGKKSIVIGATNRRTDLVRCSASYCLCATVGTASRVHVPNLQPRHVQIWNYTGCRTLPC
jgi:hypothetical protein